MMFKPFKPPSIKTKVSDNSTNIEDLDRSKKRRKLSPGVPSQNRAQSLSRPAVSTIKTHRPPLSPISNISNLEVHDESSRNGSTPRFHSVLWRKTTQKKNKTWDDDGFVQMNSGQAILYDSKGKTLGQGTVSQGLELGTILSFSGRDIEIGDAITQMEFKNTIQQNHKKGLPDQAVHDGGKSLSETRSNSKVPVEPKMTLKDQMRLQIANEKAAVAGKPTTSKLSSQPKRAAFKQPLKDDTVLQQVSSETPIPRHDPAAPGSLVFPRPDKAPPGQQIVDVVLDPLLSKRLREHQRDGIKFLYECVMDLKAFGGSGCILADDMGLGKTLQTIALLWTLMKQNPIYKAEPVVKKALIVCPVTLIQNWKKEFRKWLGRDRLGVLTLEERGSRLSMFDGRNFKVLIVGYERLRNIAEDLTRGAGIDIVICDEGHRLKTLKNKSAKAIETFNTSKRIILSGTPIQNDLSEFFAMANFVNDGCLGSYKSFLKDFENPIMKSRQPDATQDQIEKGQLASEELAQTTSRFILRRTADILSKYLPPKTEYVLFCNPTPEQTKVYQEVVRSPMFQSALGSHESALQLITILKKLCNSPALMRPDRGHDESTSSNSLTTLNEMLPAGLSRLYHNSYSSKIRLLDELLQQIRTHTDDKVILVSNYTSTLNLMANLLDSSGGRYLRLDGSTPQGKRQSIVDEFNLSSQSACFAFLLSAKAGGVGLNLIGANRLVLFDVDWNPATDDQAMARIHREGQKKPCKIYRFLIKGGLEERIWQRQVVKRGLANSIMEGGNTKGKFSDATLSGKKGKAVFSKEELKDLFRLDESDGLRTHDLIQCSCGGNDESVSTVVSTTPEPEDTTCPDDVDDKEGDRDEEWPSTSDIIKASQLTDAFIEDQENRLASSKVSRRLEEEIETEKHELMMYSHLDTSLYVNVDDITNPDSVGSLEALIDDFCLTKVLRLDKEVITGRIRYVFKKTTEPEINMENDMRTEMTSIDHPLARSEINIGMNTIER